MSRGRSRRIIVGLDLCPINVPLTEPFSISGGSPVSAKNVLVRAVLEDGSVGYGEAAPFEAVSGETQDSTMAALRDVVETIIGQDASRWRVLSTALKDQLLESPAARCAVEQAVMDALARHLGLSMVDFFGGPPGTIVTDITIPAGDVDHAVMSAQRAAEAGFGTVKVKIAADGWASDVQRVVAIVKAVSGVRVVADANGGYSLKQAREFLKGLARHRVKLALLEQPVPPAEIENLVALEREFGVPVCADEAVRNPVDIARLIHVGGVSSINVKLMKFGIVDALDVLAIARSAGMSCMIGGMIETVVSMSFSAALAIANQPLVSFVDLDTPLFMTDSVADGGISYAGELISLADETIGTGINASRHFS